MESHDSPGLKSHTHTLRPGNEEVVDFLLLSFPKNLSIGSRAADHLTHYYAHVTSLYGWIGVGGDGKVEGLHLTTNDTIPVYL